MLLYFNSPGGIFEYPSGDLGPGKPVLADAMDICDKLRFLKMKTTWGSRNISDLRNFGIVNKNGRNLFQY